MPRISKILLHVAAIGNFIIAYLQLVMLFGQPDAFLAMGMPEEMFSQASSTQIASVLLLDIVICLIIASYAYSALGVIMRLPLLLPVLIAVSVLYLLRGSFAVIGPILFEESARQIFVSATFLVIGIAFAVPVFRHPSIFRKSSVIKQK